MAQGNRLERLTGLIQAALAEILQQEVEDLRFNMITITTVGLARDLSSAKIFVSVWDETKAEETLDALNHSAKYLRFKLAHAVKLRVVPDLKFVYDDSIVRGHHISSLINAALKDTKSDE